MLFHPNTDRRRRLLTTLADERQPEVHFSRTAAPPWRSRTVVSRTKRFRAMLPPPRRSRATSTPGVKREKSPRLRILGDPQSDVPPRRASEAQGAFEDSMIH